VYPLALVALDLVTGGPVLGCMLGLLAGHLYWFATTYLPTQAPPRLRRANPFAVPAWFRRHFPRGSVAGFSSSSGSGSGSSARTTGRAQGFTVSRPEGDDAAAAVRHRWGSGQKLGGERL
jgi:Derlin-2/3